MLNNPRVITEVIRKKSFKLHAVSVSTRDDQFSYLFEISKWQNTYADRNLERTDMNILDFI